MYLASSSLSSLGLFPQERGDYDVVNVPLRFFSQVACIVEFGVSVFSRFTTLIASQVDGRWPAGCGTLLTKFSL